MCTEYFTERNWPEPVCQITFFIFNSGYCAVEKCGECVELLLIRCPTIVWCVMLFIVDSALSTNVIVD